MIHVNYKNVFVGICFVCICLIQAIRCFNLKNNSNNTIRREFNLKNCSPIEVFNLNSNVTYSFDLDEQEEQIRRTFSFNSKSKSIIMNPGATILNFYKIKLHENGQLIFLDIKVNKMNKEICNFLSQTKRDIEKNYKSKIKFLFADSILSYDFHNMWLDDDKNGSSRIHTIFFPENILVDSFICYVLVKSNLGIEVKNNNDEMFKLEKVNSGSSQLLLSAESNKNSQQHVSPVLSLYLLKLARSLDHERHELYELNFKILNENSPSSILRIIVTDVNDNSPQFLQPIFKFDIVENNAPNICFGAVSAYDSDSGVNSIVNYYIVNDSLITYRNVGYESRAKQAYQIASKSENSDKDTTLNLDTVSDLFYINKTTGELCTVSVLDRECASQYSFKVFAQDLGNLTSTPVIIELNVKDVNDNAPIFYQQGILNKDKDNAQNNLNCNSNKYIRKLAQSNIDRHVVPQFYLEENSPPHTFIAWLKAYDLDFDANALIDYYLDVIDTNETNLFNIDSNGIIRTDAMQSDYQHSNYTLKITAKDRGSIPLSNILIINIKIINKFDQINGITIDAEPNKQIFIINKNSNESLVKIKAKNSEQNLDAMKFVYQLVPYGSADSSLYGKNCNQKDIYNYFILTKQGDLFLSKNFDQFYQKNSKFNYMICFVNVRAQFLRMSSSIEFTFIILDDQLEDLNEESLIKEANALKDSFNRLQQVPRLISSKYQSSGNREIFKKNNFTLFLLLIVCVTSALFFVLIASIYIAKSKRVKKNKNSPFYKWHVLLKRFKILAKLETNNKCKNPIRKLNWLEAKKKSIKNKKSLLIYNEKERDKNCELDVKDNQTIQKINQTDLNHCLITNNPTNVDEKSLSLTNVNTTTTNTQKNEKDFINYLNFFQQNFKNNDLIELLDLSKHKKNLESPFLSYTYPSSTLNPPQISVSFVENQENKIDKSLFLYNNNSLLSNTKLIFGEEKNVSSVNEQESLQKIRNKKVCCGIYQVSNQILIDYDDNTTYEVTAKDSCDEKVIQLNKLKEPLQRFEEIYYEDTKKFKQPFSSSVLINFNKIEDSNVKSNLKNVSFGSFV